MERNGLMSVAQQPVLVKNVWRYRTHHPSFNQNLGTLTFQLYLSNSQRVTKVKYKCVFIYSFVKAGKAPLSIIQGKPQFQRWKSRCPAMVLGFCATPSWSWIAPMGSSCSPSCPRDNLQGLAQSFPQFRWIWCTWSCNRSGHLLGWVQDFFTFFNPGFCFHLVFWSKKQFSPELSSFNWSRSLAQTTSPPSLLSPHFPLKLRNCVGS